MQADSHEAPVGAEAALREVIEVDRLVGAVKGADADVHDARDERRTLVGRYRDARAVVRERLLIQRAKRGQRRESIGLLLRVGAIAYPG